MPDPPPATTARPAIVVTDLERAAYAALAEGRRADAAGLALAAAREAALGYRDDRAASLLRLAEQLAPTLAPAP